MIKPDDIMLSSAEFMALVEKYEAEDVKDYKKQLLKQENIILLLRFLCIKAYVKRILSMISKLNILKMVGEKLLHNTIKMTQLL